MQNKLYNHQFYYSKKGKINKRISKAALTLKFMFTFLEHIGFHFLTSIYRNIRFEP